MATLHALEMFVLTKEPNRTDKHVGSRVRMRRLMLKMSQQKLAAALGVTFQQVQKYERGANRISASRLQQIAFSLNVPVAFFFEEASSARGRGGFPDYIDELLGTSVGLALIKAFTAIKSPKIRAHIIRLVEEIAQDR